MTGATLKALNPVIANKQRAAGLNSEPGNYNNFVTWQVGFTFQAPLGMRSPLANTRQAQYVLLAGTCLSPAGRPPDDPLARPVLPGNRRQLQAVQDGVAAAGRRRRRLDAQRAYYEEGRDHDRPLPRRRQPVRHGRRHRGPVQDDVQHLDRRPGRSQGNAARLRQHRRGRGRRTPARPTSRPATSRTPIADSRSHPTAPRSRSGKSAPSIPTPPTTTRRQASIPPKARFLYQAPPAPWARPQRPCAPYSPARLLPNLSQATPAPGNAQPGSAAATPSASSGFQLTGGARQAGASSRTAPALIDPSVPGMGRASVADSLGRTAPQPGGAPPAQGSSPASAPAPAPARPPVTASPSSAADRAPTTFPPCPWQSTCRHSPQAERLSACVKM